jgi:hypothetical protein
MKFIPGFEELYSAEEDGRIYSHISNKYLSLNSNRRYIHVDLVKDKKYYTKDVHRLIALTFLPNPENKPKIDHIDRNKHNNAVSNLKWATSAENSANLPIYNTNKSGEQNIGTKRSVVKGKEYLYYSVEFVREGVKIFSKHFKTLPEAIEARNNYLLASSNL